MKTKTGDMKIFEFACKWSPGVGKEKKTGGVHSCEPDEKK